MVRTCTTLGITPLSRTEFEKEDARMMTEFVRRRHGLSYIAPADGYFKPITWGTYY